MIRIALASLVTLGMATSASADPAFFTWDDPTSGSLGQFSASVSSTAAQGDVEIFEYVATDASFVTEYADQFTTINLFTPPNQPGDVRTVLTFTPPLPEGALLLVVDVDFRTETVALSADGTPPMLIEQRETTQGTTSMMPTYDAGTGTLVSTNPGTESNENEVSVFDVGGVTELDVHFTNGLGSGISVTVTAPASTPVEHTTWSTIKAAYR